MTTRREKAAATPNILAPDWAGRWMDGGKGLFLAGPEMRAMAQEIIDDMTGPDGELVHAHLSEAKILILVRLGMRPNADGLVSLAKCQKATPRDRILASDADFVITVNGETWGLLPQEPADEDDPDGEAVELPDDPTPEQIEAVRQRQRYILDHELEHCGFAVGVKEFNLDGKKGEVPMRAFLNRLGSDFLSEDRKDGVGTVRFVKRRKDASGSIFRPVHVEAADGKLTLSPRCWRCRKHDLEEMTSVMTRWGRHGLSMRRLMRIFAKAQMQLTVDSEQLAGAPA
jgi:hypothetical protein